MDRIHQTPNVTLVSGLSIIESALLEAKKHGVPISICVVDRSMGLVAFARGDGATPHSVETSRRKANTAASTGKATGWMPSDLAVSLPLGSGGLLTNLPGGLPIRFSEILCGGIGVAGGTVEQDSSIAKAALLSVGAD